MILIDQIGSEKAEEVCRKITTDLPDYFGLPECNEQYAVGVRKCVNITAKIDEKYVGLISINFPYQKSSNLYWMGILREHQRKRVGTTLLQAACSYARQQGANKMSVETVAPDEADENYLKTYKFYEAQGFEPLLNLKPQGYEWNMVYMVKTFVTEY